MASCRKKRLGATGVGLLSLFLVTLTAGCGGDQAGQFAAAAIPDLTLVPDVRIDGHEHELVRPGGLTIGPGGMIAFAEGADREVRFFSPEGEELGALGGKGEGPGEFRALSRLGWVADTLWAYDFLARRVTVVAPGDPPRLDRMISLLSASTAKPAADQVDAIPEFRSVTPHALYPDGALHAVVGLPQGPAAPPFEDRGVHVRLSEDGTILSMLADYPSPPTMVTIRREGWVRALGLPWVVRPLFEIAGDGSRFAVVLTNVSGTDAGTFRVLMLGPRGDTIYERLHPFDPVPIPRAVADSVLAEGVAGEDDRAMAAAFLREATVPPVYPPLQGVKLGRDGKLWVRLRAPTAGARPRYLVLSAEGDILGRLELPEPWFRILAADESHVWVDEYDDLDVPSLVRASVEGW